MVASVIRVTGLGRNVGSFRGIPKFCTSHPASALGEPQAEAAFHGGDHAECANLRSAEAAAASGI